MRRIRSAGDAPLSQTSQIVSAPLKTNGQVLNSIVLFYQPGRGREHHCDSGETSYACACKLVLHLQSLEAAKQSEEYFAELHNLIDSQFDLKEAVYHFRHSVHGTRCGLRGLTSGVYDVVLDTIAEALPAVNFGKTMKCSIAVDGSAELRQTGSQSTSTVVVWCQYNTVFRVSMISQPLSCMLSRRDCTVSQVWLHVQLECMSVTCVHT